MPIPNPKRDNPIIKPTDVRVDANTFSILYTPYCIQHIVLYHKDCI
jgi:hypothetical protein